MAGRSRIVQLLMFLAAAGLLTAAGLLQSPVLRQTREANLINPQNAAVLQANPELAVLTTVPGGLRVMFVNYLWIRSQTAHQEGRHYDAYQLAEMICQLQPYFPGVWAFQSWNMAWNISVTTHTRRQRWQWVYNGVKLLRDRGIPLNPRSLILYKELSWIFLSKISGRLDDMHLSYKQRWGGMMQRLLGAPPYDEKIAETLKQQIDAVIEAFAQIAEAPLDKSPARQGADRFQQDRLAVLLKDPAVRAYAEALKKHGVGVDDSLLDAYNAYSLAPGVEAVRVAPPKPNTPAEKEVSKLINSAEHARPLEKLLAFVRAQILWNEYKMDPAFMLELMKRYEVPLDWRHAMSHALYWAELGIRNCRPKDISKTDVLNNIRNVLNSFKSLTATGFVTMQNRPDQPQYPLYYESADLRYIAATHKLHVDFNKKLADLTGMDIKDSYLTAGHANYLVEAINLLAADGRIAAAQRYFDYLKNTIGRTGPQWDFTSVEDFVVDNLQRETTLRYAVVLQLLQYTLKRAFVSRGLEGDEKLFRNRFDYAKRIYRTYQKAAQQRIQLPGNFDSIAAYTLGNLLSRPRSFGLNLSAADRSEIYRSMDDSPRILAPVYHRMERFLRILCRVEGIDFARAFPAPAGLEAYRRQLRQKMTTQSPDDKHPK